MRISIFSIFLAFTISFSFMPLLCLVQLLHQNENWNHYSFLFIVIIHSQHCRPLQQCGKNIAPLLFCSCFTTANYSGMFSFVHRKQAKVVSIFAKIKIKVYFCLICELEFNFQNQISNSNFRGDCEILHNS